MFEIYKRHRPVFAISEVKKVAHLLTKSLQFNDADLAASGIEILDIAQTARINEINQYIVRSRLLPDALGVELRQNPMLRQLSMLQQTDAGILKRILEDMVQQLGLDSHLLIGDLAAPTLFPGLPQVTIHSKKPLLVFNSLSHIDYAGLDPKWFDADHPAVWIGRDWLPAMEVTEAFFAISPELKLETSLNRYQPLASFGDFAIGLVRL